MVTGRCFVKQLPSDYGPSHMSGMSIHTAARVAEEKREKQKRTFAFKVERERRGDRIL
jgi:hypothetical protein